MRTEIRMAGFGGQGIITMGDILGRAAVIHAGRHASLTEDYGPEKTGGWSRADLVVSDAEIGYPIIERPGIFVALSQDGFERYQSSLDEETRVIVESDLVRLPPQWEDRALRLPATRTAVELGKKVVANIVVIGALVELTGIVSAEAARAAILDSIPKGTEALNVAAFERGRALAKEAAA